MPLTFRSHGSTHAGWKRWSQGNTRMSSPLTKSSVQIEHAVPLSDSLIGAAAADVTAASSAWSGGACVCVVVWLNDRVRSFVEALALVEVVCSGFTAPISTSLVRRCSSSLPFFGTVESASPNRTMGIVSSIARAIPLARLCRGLPMILRGP